MRILLLLTSIVLIGCSSTKKFRVDTPLYGEVNFSDQAVRKTATSASKVKVIYSKLLKGFYLNDEGDIEVSDNYKHKVLGPVNVYSNSVQSLNNSKAKRNYTLDMLKEMRNKAFLMGANAVIYAQSDVDSEKPSSTGYAVVFKSSKRTKKRRRVSSRN